MVVGFHRSFCLEDVPDGDEHALIGQAFVSWVGVLITSQSGSHDFHGVLNAEVSREMGSAAIFGGREITREACLQRITTQPLVFPAVEEVDESVCPAAAVGFVVAASVVFVQHVREHREVLGLPIDHNRLESIRVVGVDAVVNEMNVEHVGSEGAVVCQVTQRVDGKRSSA